MMKKETGQYLILLSMQRQKIFLFLQLMPNKEMSNKKKIEKLLYLILIRIKSNPLRRKIVAKNKKVKIKVI